MENNNAHIIAISLGIPSTTLLSIALLLAFRFCYRPLQWVDASPTTPTVTTNQTESTDGIPLQQRSPGIVAPVPRWPILINDFTRVTGETEDISESVPSVIPERRPPTPPRRHTPIIVISPTSSTDSLPYAPQSPSPGEYTCYRADRRGFDVGRDIRVTAPLDTRNHSWDVNPPAPLPPVSPSEFWDNITIPYSAYFPAPPDVSPAHRTPPPAAYWQEWGAPPVWDQHVQNPEYTPEPVRAVKEPITSSSTAHLYPPRYSYWQNVEGQCRSPQRPPRANAWERLANRLQEWPQPPPELLTPPQLRHGHFPIETSDSDTLYEPPHPPTPFPTTISIDGIRESPEPSSESPLPPSNPNPPTDDANWCHPILWKNHYGH